MNGTFNVVSKYFCLQCLTVWNLHFRCIRTCVIFLLRTCGFFVDCRNENHISGYVIHYKETDFCCMYTFLLTFMYMETKPWKDIYTLYPGHGEMHMPEQQGALWNRIWNREHEEKIGCSKGTYSCCLFQTFTHKVVCFLVKW